MTLYELFAVQRDINKLKSFYLELASHENFNPNKTNTITDMPKGTGRKNFAEWYTEKRDRLLQDINFYNNIHTDDLKNIKPLIDVYDKVFSGFINDLEDVQELIFVLSGYEGTDLNGFLQDLKKYKAIKLDDTEHSGVSTLNIEIPIEARNSVLEAARRAIFEQGQGFDPQPENFGNQSGEALKFMYSLLEMKAGLTETEFQLGFAKLIRAICGFYNLKCAKIIQTWTRTCIKNDSETAQICRDSVGIISKKTILKNHPFVEDCDKEMEQLKIEEEEAQEKAEIYKFPLRAGEEGEDADKDGDAS